jgi:hypothetical protein
LFRTVLRRSLSPSDVVPADPDSLSAAVCPMSRPPDVIGPPDVIPGAMRVIRPIPNLDRDGAWGGDIARGTGITGPVWSVTGAVWAISPVTRAVSRRTSIIFISASAYAHYDWKEKEQESQSFRFGFRFHIAFPLVSYPKLATPANETKVPYAVFAGPEDNAPFFQISVPIQPGNSGGGKTDSLRAVCLESVE